MARTGINNTLSPWQIEVVSLPRPTVGGALTAIVTVSFELHPLASVPVTTYSVSTDGFTVMLGVVSLVDQLYVEAPVLGQQIHLHMNWSELTEIVGSLFNLHICYLMIYNYVEKR